MEGVNIDNSLQTAALQQQADQANRGSYKPSSDIYSRFTGFVGTIVSSALKYVVEIGGDDQLKIPAEFSFGTPAKPAKAKKC